MMVKEVDLTNFGVERVRTAVEAAIRGAVDRSDNPLPAPERLEQAAKAVIARREDELATYFQSILETAYLVASSDGFADDERQALALLLERLTGRAVSNDILELHFRDLDDACEALGRRERLRRAAEDFSDGLSRTEALGFAALIAMADGKLAEQEIGALVELGGHLGFSPDKVAEVIEGVVNQLRAVLES